MVSFLSGAEVLSTALALKLADSEEHAGISGSWVTAVVFAKAGQGTAVPRPRLC
jgi:hypothetical protein